MQLIKPYTLLVYLLLLAPGGCDYHSARDEFDRQIKICSLAEDNGLLDPAVEACGTALAIAEKEFEQELISTLLYRLGRLERQRGRFQEAEVMVQRSLAIEETSGISVSVASRLIELSFSLSGQDRWSDGAKLLKRASPLVSDLTGQDRKAAANAYRMFSIRLDLMGHSALAEQFKADAEKLAGS